ncbi:cadherin domain-containing protein [Fibrobacter sp.]|uniref:cadherin domain-containing protein n=1 Tax=Fibrobacter sp. TaxID=35828 RepID=UPI003864CB6F
MKKGNLSLRTFLSTVVAAMGLAVPVSAEDEPAVERDIIKLDPLYFQGVTTEAENQKLWNELMKYKLWGTESFSTKEEFKIEEPSGYTGTANGDIWFKEHTHTLGGPIVSAQNLNFQAGNTDHDKFIKGPVYAKDLKLPDNWNNGRDQSYEGIYCFEGKIEFDIPNLTEKRDDYIKVLSQYVEVIHNNGGQIYADWADPSEFTAEEIARIKLDGPFKNCPDDVPRPEVNLTVPLLNDDGIVWESAISLDGGDTQIEYVHIPPVTLSDLENEHFWYDKFVQNIFLQNHGKTIYIVMPSEKQNCDATLVSGSGECEYPKTGRLTRIFSKEGVNIQGSASDARILVAYVNDDVEWVDNAWKIKDGDEYKEITEENLKIVSDDEYAGNLLFYTPADILWPQMQSDGATDLQGTYMTAGDFSIQDHMNIAGQLIAGKNLSFGAKFNGKFHYVPFNAIEVKPDIFYSNGFKEDNYKWYNMQFYLTDTAHTDVSIEYCFSFFDEIEGADTKYAAYKGRISKEFAKREDLGENPTEESDIHFMPFCAEGKTRTLVIKKGNRKPTVESLSAFIKVVDDQTVEDDEFMLFRIINLNGATISGNRFDGGLLIKLIDSNNRRPHFINPEKTNLAVPENATKANAGTIRAVDDEGDVFRFRIVGGTAKDLFDINQTTGVVTMKDGVDPFDYEAWYELKKDDPTKEPYDIKVEICDAKATSYNVLLCDDFTFKVSIQDVNEKPYFTSTDVIHIAENKTSATDTVKFADLDKYNTNGLFTMFDEVIAVGGDTDIFTVTQDGIVQTKRGVVLDYEVKNEYKLTLQVRDGSRNSEGELIYPDLYDEMVFKIVVTDVKDGPEFDARAYNGTVEENSPAGTKVKMKSPIIATTTQAGATITYSLLDESKSFVIDPKTGVITVAENAILDYEKKNEYKMKVVATDKADIVDQTAQYDTAEVVVNLIDVNERPIFVEPTKKLTFPENAKGYVIDTLLFDDYDKVVKFRNNRFELVGDVNGFYLDPVKGVLTTTRKFDYETEEKKYDLKIRIYDASDKSLIDSGIVTVELINANEDPYLKEVVFEIPEDAAVGTELKKPLEAIDPDDLDGSGKYTFYILEKGKEVSATKEFKLNPETGVISVASALDYEKNESYVLDVRVKDADGGSSDTIVTIRIIDVNEAPSVTVDTIYVNEDQVIKEPFGSVKTDKDDPDTKNPDFRNNIYENIDKSDVIFIKSNGDAVLLKPVDYESDSVYVITVRVTDKDDKTLTSTKKVVVKVKDVYEKSEVVITRVETKDSVYLKPDTVYVNVPVVDIEWTADGKPRSSRDTLHLGVNPITKTYKDPTKNAPGSATVVIIYSTAAPIVTVSASGEDVKAENIYTVVEKATKNDSAIYVNDKKNDIKVTVKDSASNVSKSFTVKLELDTVAVSSKEFKNIKSIADSKVTRKKDPASGITTIPENGSYTKNSYTDEVNGFKVTVTYYTDSKGKDVKRSVITSSGKKKDIAVIEVSYTVNIGGKDVTLSYFADASTGERVTLNTGLTDSESVLSADGDDVTGSYKVSYTYKDKSGNTVDVSYFLDEKGKIAKNNEGNIGYNVGYTYVNIFGNSSRKDIFVVLDQKGPVVKIESPYEDAVLNANFTVVKWTVNGEEQDTLRVQGLENGVNTIVRVFRDKAGNESRDSVHVMVKKAREIDIDVEKPVTTVDRDSVEKYYKDNPPKDNQDYSVTFVDQKTGKETEVIAGIHGKAKDGSGKEPYENSEGGHLGPTLMVDARVPVVNAVGGLATLDDIMSAGGMVALEGVDAANGKKIPVEDYVNKYCTDDFKKAMKSTDYSHMNLYSTKLKVKIWVYTNTGAFADYFSFDYDLDDPDYVNDGGLLKFYFEMKPDKNGDIRTKKGRLYGTGAYLFKTEVRMSSKLRCDLPPLSDDQASKKKNAVIKTSDELLRPFGYRRPVNK